MYENNKLYWSDKIRSRKLMPMLRRISACTNKDEKYRRQYKSPGYKHLQLRVKQFNRITTNKIQNGNSRSFNGLRYARSQLPGK